MDGWAQGFIGALIVIFAGIILFFALISWVIFIPLKILTKINDKNKHRIWVSSAAALIPLALLILLNTNKPILWAFFGIISVVNYFIFKKVY